MHRKNTIATSWLPSEVAIRLSDHNKLTRNAPARLSALYHWLKVMRPVGAVLGPLCQHSLIISTTEAALMLTNSHG